MSIRQLAWPTGTLHKLLFSTPSFRSCNTIHGDFEAMPWTLTVYCYYPLELTVQDNSNHQVNLPSSVGNVSSGRMKASSDFA